MLRLQQVKFNIILKFLLNIFILYFFFLSTSLKINPKLRKDLTLFKNFGLTYSDLREPQIFIFCFAICVDFSYIDFFYQLFNYIQI